MGETCGAEGGGEDEEQDGGDVVVALEVVELRVQAEDGGYEGGEFGFAGAELVGGLICILVSDQVLCRYGTASYYLDNI